MPESRTGQPYGVFTELHRASVHTSDIVYIVKESFLTIIGNEHDVKDYSVHHDYHYQVRY